MNLPNGYLLQQGKYKLTQVVGQGGFGITYKGVWFTEVKGALGTIHTEVPVCIKEFFFKDYCDRDPETQAVSVHSETGKQLFGKFREKLIKEAKILSDVHHPYIVNVLEVFEENNTAYIVMEYIAGQSLKSANATTWNSKRRARRCSRSRKASLPSSNMTTKGRRAFLRARISIPWGRRCITC